MKKILLILFVSFFIASLSYAGGDDRDQVLPLNSLNEDYDETPNFLKEDDSELALPNERRTTEQTQPKLISQVIGVDSQNASVKEITNSAKSLVSKYMKSDQGILIMLILFVVGLILLFNFFVREKNN
jgi:hypothetical protein